MKVTSVWLAAAEGSSTPEAPLTVKHRFGLLKVNDFLPQIWNANRITI